MQGTSVSCELLFITSCVPLFATPWGAACQVSLCLTVSWSLPTFIFIVSVMPSSHLILWCPLLLLFSIFPRNFSNESSVCIRCEDFVILGTFSSLGTFYIDNWLIYAEQLWRESLILQESCRPESSGRNSGLVDQSHQATTWWKLISVPVSPDLIAVQVNGD